MEDQNITKGDLLEIFNVYNKRLKAVKSEICLLSNKRLQIPLHIYDGQEH